MGIEPLYDEFQNVPNVDSNDVNVPYPIYNKVITNDKKDLNLITDIPDSYSITMMETIAEYLNKKYGKEKNHLAMTLPITNFTNKFKQLNPSVNGKRVTAVLDSIGRIWSYVKDRNTMQRMTGTGDKKSNG